MKVSPRIGAAGAGGAGERHMSWIANILVALVGTGRPCINSALAGLTSFTFRPHLILHCGIRSSSIAGSVAFARV
jgi:hypothetical protein